MIKKFGTEFFDIDDIVNAKKWLGSKLFPDALFQKRTGLKAPLSHLENILDFIKRGNTDDFDIPVFCILSPSEVPFSSQVEKCTRYSLFCSLFGSERDAYPAKDNF